MANFKKQILDLIKGEVEDSDFEILSRAQENLLKNYSNPVLKDSDREIVLENYRKLQKIGESLYKKRAFLANNMTEEAQNESDSAEQTVLTGGVSYNQYIWHSEKGEHTCKECLDLDGQVFDFADEIPDRPHPNCQCTVEVVSSENLQPATNNDEDNKPCDCHERLSADLEVCKNACAKAEEVNNDLIKSSSDLKNDLDKFSAYPLDKFKYYYNEAKALVDKAIDNIQETIFILDESKNIFYNKWKGLCSLTNTLGEYTKNSAEYYHAVANCEAAQLGDTGVKAATFFGFMREAGDFFKEIIIRRYSVQKAIENSIHDLEINERGRQAGILYPNASCEEVINDIYKVDWPKDHKKNEGAPEL